ncbi:MAG: hypothetical protein H0X37_11930 [Herpetosiphonaceae bacterium]|nr:hypothetical protein [Herpetosiphonaceae bacterium]
MSNYVSAVMCGPIASYMDNINSMLDVIRSEGWKYDPMISRCYNIYVPGEGDFIYDNTQEDKIRYLNFDEIKILLPRAQRASIKLTSLIDVEQVEINVHILKEDVYFWLSLDIEDSDFLPNPSDTLVQWEDPIFAKLRSTVLGMISLLAPSIAAVGWEADLECKQHFPHGIFWGNFWNEEIVKSLSEQDLATIMSLSHHWSVIENRGVLFWVGNFLYPQDYNQTLEKLYLILSKYH